MYVTTGPKLAQRLLIVMLWRLIQRQRIARGVHQPRTFFAVPIETVNLSTVSVVCIHNMVIPYRRSFLWSPYGIGQTIIFSSRDFFYLLSSFFFSSPNLSGRRLDIYHTSYFYTWCGLSANLECRSEMSCTWLAENTGCKNDSKNRHLGTIAQLCRAMSSQLRHVSTMGKKSC